MDVFLRTMLSSCRADQYISAGKRWRSAPAEAPMIPFAFGAPFFRALQTLSEVH